MNLETVALLAEIRAKILEAAVMLNNDYARKEVLEHLLKIADNLSNFAFVTKE